MTHALLGADRAAHFRILAIAMAAAIAVALMWSNASVSGGDAAADRSRASAVVFKAGKPAVSAALGATTMR